MDMHVTLYAYLCISNAYHLPTGLYIYTCWSPIALTN